MVLLSGGSEEREFPDRWRMEKHGRETPSKEILLFPSVEESEGLDLFPVKETDSHLEDEKKIRKSILTLKMKKKKKEIDRSKKKKKEEESGALSSHSNQAPRALKQTY